MKKAKQNKSKILLILAGLGLGAYLYFSTDKKEKKENKEEQKQDEKKIGENVLYPDFSEMTQTETETEFAQDINTPLEFERVDPLDNRKNETKEESKVEIKAEKDVDELTYSELIEESGLNNAYSKSELRDVVRRKRLEKTNPLQADIEYILFFLSNHDYNCCLQAYYRLKKYSGTQYFTEIINTISNAFSTDTEDKFIELWLYDTWNNVKQLMIDNNIELSESALQKEKSYKGRNQTKCKHDFKTGLEIKEPETVDESRIYSKQEPEEHIVQIDVEAVKEKTLDNVKNQILNNRLASSNTSYVGRSGSSGSSGSSSSSSSSSSSGRTGSSSSGRISNVIKL